MASQSYAQKKQGMQGSQFCREKGTKTGNDGTFGTQIPERKKEMEIRGRGLREMDIMKEKEEKQGNKRPFDSFKTAVINIIKRITS